MQQFECLRLLVLLRGPVDKRVLYTVIGEIAGGTRRSEELIAVFHETPGSIEHVSFLLGSTRREQYRMLRDTLTYSELCLEQCLIGVIA